jgi:hypothetical protein
VLGRALEQERVPGLEPEQALERVPVWGQVQVQARVLVPELAPV